MLTKDDLKEIKKIMREEVGNEVKSSSQTLESQIRLSRMQIQSDIASVEDRVKNLEIKLVEIDKELNRKINRVQKTLNIAIKMFDETDVKHNKRISLIEDHLGLTSKN